MAPRARKGGSGKAGPGHPQPAWPAQLDRSLVTRALGGEEAAQRQVFEGARPMIARLARARADQGLSEEDLVQEGSVGLLAALHEYSGGVDAAFESYVEARVGQQMDRALQEEQGALQEEKQLVEDANAFEQAELALGRELNRAASPEEIRARLGWTPERLDDVAAAVEDARQRHDEELAAFLDPEYFDPLDWIGDDADGTDGGPEEGHDGGAGP